MRGGDDTGYVWGRDYIKGGFGLEAQLELKMTLKGRMDDEEV